MKDIYRSISTTVGLCAAVVLLTACPGSLANWDAYGDGGVVTKDAETILADNCTVGCHNATQKQADLDLLSPDVASRVVDKNATGIGCTNRILVVAGDPDSSYLIDKVLNVPGICGGQMPVVGSLSGDEIETLRQWIVDLGDSFGGTLDGG